MADNFDYFAWSDHVLASSLTPPQRLVALAMGRYGQVCFASQSTLAKRTGLSRRTVWGAIQALAKTEWISRGDDPRQTVVWTLATYAGDAYPYAGDAYPYAGVAQPYAGDAYPPTQQLHTKESEERIPKELPKEWEAPLWFLPLTSLTGYKKTNHDRAVKRIEDSCASASVDIAKVVSAFANEYEVLKHSYGWSDPVAVLKGRPLAIAISKAKQSNERSNGHGELRSDTQAPASTMPRGW